MFLRSSSDKHLQIQSPQEISNYSTWSQYTTNVMKDAAVTRVPIDPTHSEENISKSSNSVSSGFVLKIFSVIVE